MGLIEAVSFTDHTSVNVFLRAARSQHKEPALTNRKNYRQSCSEKVPEAGGNYRPPLTAVCIQLLRNCILCTAAQDESLVFI